MFKKCKFFKCSAFVILVTAIMVANVVSPSWGASVSMTADDTGPINITASGNTNITTGDDTNITTGDTTNLTAGATTNITAGDGAVITTGDDTDITTGDNTTITTGATTNLTSGEITNITASGNVNLTVIQPTIALPVISHSEFVQTTVSSVPSWQYVTLSTTVDPTRTAIIPADSAGKYVNYPPVASPYGEWRFVDASNNITTQPTNRVGFHCDGGSFDQGASVLVFGQVVEYNAPTEVRRLHIPLTFSSSQQYVDLEVAAYDPARTIFVCRRIMAAEEWRIVAVVPVDSTHLRVYYRATASRSGEADFDMIIHWPPSAE